VIINNQKLRDYDIVLSFLKLRGSPVTVDDIHRETGLQHNTIQRAINFSLPENYPDIVICRKSIKGDHRKFYWLGSNHDAVPEPPKGIELWEKVKWRQVDHPCPVCGSWYQVDVECNNKRFGKCIKNREGI